MDLETKEPLKRPLKYYLLPRWLKFRYICQDLEFHEVYGVVWGHKKIWSSDKTLISSNDMFKLYSYMTESLMSPAQIKAIEKIDNETNPEVN